MVLYYNDQLIANMNTLKKYAYYKREDDSDDDDLDDTNEHKIQDFYTVYLTNGTNEEGLDGENGEGEWRQTLIIDKIPITNTHFALFVDI